MRLDCDDSIIPSSTLKAIEETWWCFLIPQEVKEILGKIDTKSRYFCAPSGASSGADRSPDQFDPCMAGRVDVGRVRTLRRQPRGQGPRARVANEAASSGHARRISIDRRRGTSCKLGSGGTSLGTSSARLSTDRERLDPSEKFRVQHC